LPQQALPTPPRPQPADGTTIPIQHAKYELCDAAGNVLTVEKGKEKDAWVLARSFVCGFCHKKLKLGIENGKPKISNIRAHIRVCSFKNNLSPDSPSHLFFRMYHLLAQKKVTQLFFLYS